MKKFRYYRKTMLIRLKHYFITIFSIVLIAMCLSQKGLAQGNLMIMPKRVVFEGSKRSHELNLANTGQDTARYVISLMHYRMKEDGSFEEMNSNDSAANFADKFVRFFPRSVTLGPNEAQTVRIQLIQTSKLLTGEYRSHIYFRAVPNEKPRGEKVNSNPDSSALSIKLVPVFGISIPVIIRVGESTTKGSITNSSFELFDANSPILKLTLNRSGNMSTYGDIMVEHISPSNKKTKVGNIQGLSVYTPNLIRHIRIGLNNNAGVDYTKGKLVVEYKTQDNPYTIIAQAEVHLSVALVPKEMTKINR